MLGCRTNNPLTRQNVGLLHPTSLLRHHVGFRHQFDAACGNSGYATCLLLGRPQWRLRGGNEGRGGSGVSVERVAHRAAPATLDCNATINSPLTFGPFVSCLKTRHFLRCSSRKQDLPLYLPVRLSEF
ncbi:hypothetical protein RRG08_033977 [Elysia crispata]|uniref:Uncharacterized protein n=1 Tax=Elysia crispata TaxID=231223 RepID=A0AAE0YRM6_9GAST|nr:hypothetical protein RRG08_033977 [Elysia crispata]